eukprot:2806036-Prymnesium_polylepis.1
MWGMIGEANRRFSVWSRRARSGDWSGIVVGGASGARIVLNDVARGGRTMFCDVDGDSGHADP